MSLDRWPEIAAVLAGESDGCVVQGDNLSVLAHLPEKSVDLIFGSPPYEAARTYGIDFNLKGQDWVDWMVARTVWALRACRGLVAWVVEGRTRDFRWSATPAMLMADLHRQGICLRKPPAFQRVGIPGSGGPDWLRNDYEFIVCCTNGGKLPWSDNTAMGHAPKWAPGGEMSNRRTSGARVNQWGHSLDSGATVVAADGTVRSKGRRPLHVHIEANGEAVVRETRAVMSADRDGTHHQTQSGYTIPAKANPGNVIECIVGGGVMGDKLCHENEAPFPEALAEFFIRSFCPPGGIVCDPFSGSGTVASVAKMHGRKWIGIDVRQTQVDLATKRIARARIAATPKPLFPPEPAETQADLFETKEKA